MKRGLIATVSVATLLLGTATPASADPDVITGAGAGTGWEYAQEHSRPAQNCINPLSADLTSRFEIDHVGVYTGVDAGNPLALPVTYVGPSHVNAHVPNYAASPVGTHDPDIDPTCLVPLPVPLTASVTSPGSDPLNFPNLLGQGVSCATGNGLFLRVQSAAVITFTSQCTVKNGGGQTATAQVRHVLEGTMVPCTFPPFDENTPNPVCTAGAVLNPPQPVSNPEAWGSYWDGAYEAVGADNLTP